MRYRSAPAWPGLSAVLGDRAKLVSVEYREEPPERRLVLTATRSGRTVTGALMLDDEPLLPFLQRQLGRFIGRAIADIGEALDLDVQLDLLRTSVRSRLLDGRLPRPDAARAPLTAGQPLSRAIRLGSAQGRACAACDAPILTRQQRPFYLSTHGAVVLDELCERIWLEER